MILILSLFAPAILMALALALGVTGWCTDKEHRHYAVIAIILSLASIVSIGNLSDHAFGRVRYEEHVSPDGSRSWVRVRVSPATQPVQAEGRVER